jgi:hypothetical protein
MDSIAGPAQLSRFFAAYTEHAFLDELGVADTRLVDYLAGLLCRFIHREDIFAHRTASRQTGQAWVDMVHEVDRRPADGPARRERFRHIGDFALFWTGVFPEAVKRQDRWAKAQIEAYTEQGKRSYFVASTYCDTPDQAKESPLLRRLSDEFELCAVGLRRARDLWEADQPSPGPEGPTRPNS